MKTQGELRQELRISAIEAKIKMLEEELLSLTMDVKKLKLGGHDNQGERK